MKIIFENKTEIVTEYNIGDNVSFDIADGIVIGISIEGNNIMYKIGYFLNEDYFQIVLYPNQFKLIETKSKKGILGFSKIK